VTFTSLCINMYLMYHFNVLLQPLGLLKLKQSQFQENKSKGSRCATVVIIWTYFLNSHNMTSSMSSYSYWFLGTFAKL
jgi:hypothetical protein